MKSELFPSLRAAQNWLRDNGWSMVNPRLWEKDAIAALIRDIALHGENVIVRFEKLP